MTDASAVVPARDHPIDARVPEDPRDWIATMCCPRCRSTLTVIPFVRSTDGRLKEGELSCGSCQQVVATIAQFKFDFHAKRPISSSPTELRVSTATCERRVHADSPEISRSPRWHPVPPFHVYSEGQVGDTCKFTGVFTDALVRLRNQPNGGLVDVFVDNSLMSSTDLYIPEGSFTLPTIAATDVAPTWHELVIATRGTAPSESTGSVALFEELVLYGPAEFEGFHPAEAINYGNPYSEFIESYLARATASDLVLEIGGGDRRRVKPNHLNFEFVKFELADVYGDIHALPFNDDSFDIVHSQAVFEHIADPFTAAKELVRVTKPGGLLLTEVAFLQPLHAVPFHFFNMTLWGVQELFKDCDTIAADWFGPLSHTLSWILDAAGLTQKLAPEKLDRLHADFRDFDELMNHHELKPVASGVHIAVRKPDGSGTTTQKN